jgi:phage I-like protein
MLKWLRGSDGAVKPVEVQDGLEDVEFKPEKMKEDITTSFKTELDARDAKMDERMKPMQELALSIKQERDERIAREAAAKAKQDKEDKGDFSERILVDPENAINEKLQPTQIALLKLASREARRETLGEKEYYYGDLKSKVDALIETLPLNQQTNSASIENCYKLIMYDHQKDITDGKIKARNTSMIFDGGSTGGHGGKEKGDDTETLSTEEKHIAERLGVSEADWKKSRKELSYV